uniref:Uncharacterized protein n=1 Tax=Romanomermis culicivorax TaxID=13658 RepID=A0A915K742_ROMCU
MIENDEFDNAILDEKLDKIENCQILALIYDPKNNPNLIIISTNEIKNLKIEIKNNDKNFNQILNLMKKKQNIIVVYNLKLLIFEFYENLKIDISQESRDLNWFCVETALWMLDFRLDLDKGNRRSEKGKNENEKYKKMIKLKKEKKTNFKERKL